MAIDSIEQMLSYMEDKTVPEGSNCIQLFEAIEKLEKSPKDYIMIYINLKQFVRHQLTRGNFVPNSDTESSDINIIMKHGNLEED